MMVFFFFFFFLAPLFMYINFWYIYQFCLVMFLLFFVLMRVDIFYSYLVYGYGMDYFSYGLVMLSLFISSLMVLVMYMMYSNLFLFLNLSLLFCLIMVFMSLNVFLFYLFFEFSLIPLLVLILGWGYQPERLVSGLYLFFYTLFASLPLLLFIFYLYFSMYVLFFDLLFSRDFSLYMIFCSVFAFLVKFPMYMFHFWLPSAHVQAPISGSMILAGLMLSVGGYGMIRMSFITEICYYFYSSYLYSFCIVGTILVSLICFSQGDLKIMIAYSSVAHMGICIMGILVMVNVGYFGCYMMMISHGLCSSALFCLANMSYDRLLSRSFYLNSGMMVYMPSLTFFWFIFCSFNMGCPPSLNFLSEVLIINGMFSYFSFSGFYFIFISFFSACFSFYLFSFSQHGTFHSMYSISLCNVNNYLLLFNHLYPLFFLIFIVDYFF